MLYINTEPFLFKRHQARVSLTSTARFKRLVIVLPETFEPRLVHVAWESAAASNRMQWFTSRTYLMFMYFKYRPWTLTAAVKDLWKSLKCFRNTQVHWQQVMFNDGYKKSGHPPEGSVGSEVHHAVKKLHVLIVRWFTGNTSRCTTARKLSDSSHCELAVRRLLLHGALGSWWTLNQPSYQNKYWKCKILQTLLQFFLFVFIFNFMVRFRHKNHFVHHVFSLKRCCP